MALAMNNMTAMQSDVMDIDIDMDIDDVGPTEGDEMIEEGEADSLQPQQRDLSGIIPEIYNEDPAKEPQWQKLHLRGVDDMHTNDILAFAKDHFPHSDPHVQWIDDTSANLVFETRDAAREALLAFVATPTSSETIQNDPFVMRTAKPLASRPSSILTIRIAQAGDRKRKNARDASRWYLLHPEDDPGERTRREFANSRPGRGGGENGDYRRRRFDEREHRRRRDNDHNAGTEDFSADMYDDAPAADPSTTKERGRDLFARVSKGRRRRSASPGDGTHHHADAGSEEETGRLGRRGASHYRDRTSPPPYSRRDPNPFPRTNVGKELFSSDTNTSGTLRSDLFASTSSPTLLQQQQTSTSSPRNNNSTNPDHRQSNVAAARRLKADLLAASTRNPGTYPTSPRNGGGHRRSHAMDAKNEEDLVERFGRKSLSADSTKHVTAKTHNSGVELFPSSSSFSNNVNNNSGGGLSIKGNATVGGGFSFKGRAGAEQVKELFPEQYSGGRTNGSGNNNNNSSGNGNGNNRGKELFDAPVREKGRRQRAGDLFD